MMQAIIYIFYTINIKMIKVISDLKAKSDAGLSKMSHSSNKIRTVWVIYEYRAPNLNNLLSMNLEGNSEEGFSEHGSVSEVLKIYCSSIGQNLF